MLKKDFKRYSIVLVFLFLSFYTISAVSILNNINFINSDSNNIKNIPFSIKTSSNDPPNKDYFKYYKTITIPHENVFGSGSHKNFPVLISIFDSDLYDDVQSNGNDIAFANDTDWLDHEIEHFNQSYSATHAQLIAWVRIPSLSTSVNTTIYMYYGNATMSSRQNSTSVWDSSYKGVWHLSESSGSAGDSTSHDTSGTVSGTVNRGMMGTVDGAYDFGTNGQINYGDPSDGHLDMGTGSFTISFWMNIDTGTSNYQLPLYKGATTYDEAGYDFETNVDATSLTFHICDNTDIGEAHGFDINFDSWAYVTGVVDRSTNYMRLYKDGTQVSSTVSISNIGSISSTQSLLTPPAIYDLNGLLDEIRICNVARTAGWILTEYNNQDDPGMFFSLSSEIVIDNIPPFYSDLIESSDPLELGGTEIIKINVFDLSGMNQVKINYIDSNYSMTNIGGDTWQYDSWIPTSIDNYTYTIWMEDNYHNWNFTSGSIEVIDTTPPSYSDLIESADPLQFGQNETISIKVYDAPGSGVNQTLLEYDSSNHTMDFIGGNTWSWNKWKPNAPGIHPYKIYMQDNEDNWNMTSGTITVLDTTAPVIDNLTESEDPLELGSVITINIDVFDNETSVSTVLIEFENVNNTMIHMGGNTYQYNWTKSVVGIVYYIIYANDSDNNWNSLSNSFDIVDTTPPNISDLFESENPLEFGSTVTISVNSTDLSNIKQLKIEFEGSNHTMTNVVGNTWQYDLWNPTTTGNCFYTIWAEDNNNNWDFISGSVFIQDTTPPSYSDLIESANPVELGTLLTISINTIDLSDIKEILIEFESSNYTMANLGGDVWYYDSWTPNIIGNYTYKIFITDNNDNVNYINSWILFIDTILPDCKYLFESADPLELGDNQIIRINAYDFTGINRSLIEYEGVNHSMVNIYGNTWQFDSWRPNNWTYYQYRIYVEDKSGNWNLVLDNITVQDTMPPSPPILTNGPSGDVSGNLVFDWSEGSDPSGISYYILIIDNETDPSITPGYVYNVNLTNTGSGSSYFELTEELPSGKYYYFLAQIDGTCHQSSYTVGSFTIMLNQNPTDLMIYIIIAIALVSVMGSVSIIVVMRKRSQNKIKAPRKKIPLKLILHHIGEISSSFEANIQDLSIQKPSSQSFISEITPEKKVDKDDIDEIKKLGEELFEEGAYLEAIKQFEYAKDILGKDGKEEEVVIVLELITGIKGLIKEREIRIEALDTEKITGNSIKIFELYQEVIEISKKLKDFDALNMFKSEMIDFYNVNKIKLLEIQRYRNNLEEQAELSSSNGQYEKSIHEYEMCELISELIMNFNKNEKINVEKFRNKKLDLLKKIKKN